MKNLRFLAPASLLFALLSLAMLAGCGPTGGGGGKDTCATQEECGAGKVCINFVDGKGTCGSACAKLDNQGNIEHLPSTDPQAGAPAMKGCAGSTALSCTYFGTGNTPAERKKWLAACVKTCTQDSECGAKNLTCQDDPYNSGKKICVAKPCTQDSECGVGRMCGSNGVCQVKSSSAPECTGDEQCGVMETCDTTKKCVKPNIVTIIIKDKTTDTNDQRCKDKDSGSDITGVSLVNASGVTVAWGRATSISTGVKAPQNPYASANPPDGNAPDPTHFTGGDKCTQSKLTNGKGSAVGKYISIGCGGVVSLGFTSGITEGKVRVYEYSTKLCTGSTSSAAEDQYEVYACNQSSLTTVSGVNSSLSNPHNCIKLGEGEAYGEFSYPPSSP